MQEFSHIRNAAIDDVQLLVKLEGMQENSFVQNNSVEEHTHGILDDKNMIYLIAESSGGQVLGYAILFRESSCQIEFRRIVTVEKGKGLGTLFIRAILAHVFADNNTQNIWLDVYEANKRAQHVYQKLGFEINDENKTQIHPEFGRLIIMELNKSRYQRLQP
jgi:RimJ/RimL family protein N-acetyltransferase